MVRGTRLHHHRQEEEKVMGRGREEDDGVHRRAVDCEVLLEGLTRGPPAQVEEALGAIVEVEVEVGAGGGASHPFAQFPNIVIFVDRQMPRPTIALLLMRAEVIIMIIIAINVKNACRRIPTMGESVHHIHLILILITPVIILSAVYFMGQWLSVGRAG